MMPFDYMEIEEETMQMRIFAQILGGEDEKWFKNLTPNRIHDLPSLYQNFINKWEIKKKRLQIPSEYKNLKRNVGESIQDYCTRFNSVYNALPPHMKPPPGLALVKFPEGFDPDMTYQLRERDPTNLEEMQRGAISAESNLILTLFLVRLASALVDPLCISSKVVGSLSLNWYVMSDSKPSGNFTSARPCGGFV